MAKLRAGILGSIRGKVAGVVGGQWRDVAYIREYVKPANPNTSAQQTQRTKFSDAVAWLRPLVGPVANVYVDPLVKGQSGWNRLIKDNIDVFDGSPDYSAIQLTKGKTYLGGVSNSDCDGVDDDVTITFSTALGNTGLATDKVYAVAYNEASGLWGFAAAEVERSVGEIVVPLDMDNDDSIHTWTWAARYTGSVVSQVSDSIYDSGTAVV
jgi:hypothetical protein